VHSSSFPGAHRPGHDRKNSPPPTGVVKNEWYYAITPFIAFKAWKWKIVPFIKGTQKRKVSMYLQSLFLLCLFLLFMYHLFIYLFISLVHLFLPRFLRFSSFIFISPFTFLCSLHFVFFTIPCLFSPPLIFQQLLFLPTISSSEPGRLRH